MSDLVTTNQLQVSSVAKVLAMLAFVTSVGTETEATNSSRIRSYARLPGQNIWVKSGNVATGYSRIGDVSERLIHACGMGLSADNVVTGAGNVFFKESIDSYSSLTNALLAAKVEADSRLDAEARELCAVAYREALVFSIQYLRRLKPVYEIADEGSVLLRWEKGRSGVILLFTGDGTVIVSVRKPRGSYSAGAREYDLKYKLPEAVWASIAAMDAALTQ